MKSVLSKITLGQPSFEAVDTLLEIRDVYLFPRKIVRALLFVACGLFILHNLGVFYVYVLGHEVGIVRKLYARIDMNAENNAPSLFSFAILLFASLLLFLVSRIEIHAKTGDRRYWQILSFVFLFLSFDEAFSVHEKFSAIKNFISFGNSSLFKHAWIIPYSFGVLILGLFFLKFFFRLRKRTQTLFFISGFLYCFSAIGFELIESYVAIKVGNLAELYALCGIEEFLEMCSIILFIYAIFDYLASTRAKILFSRTR